MPESEEMVDGSEALKAKVRAFVEGLDPEEAAVIEGVFAAAASEADREDDEVAGFVLDPGFSPNRMAFVLCVSACLRRQVGVGPLAAKAKCSSLCSARYPR